MARAENSGFGDGGFSFDDGNGAIADAASLTFGANSGVDGSANGGDAGSGSDTGKRKRKPRSDAGKPRGKRGSGGSKAAVSAASVDTLSQGIMVLSGMLAGMTKSPEFQFDKGEADTEAKAIADLMAQFDFVPDPKVQAFVNFAFVTGGIIGAKIYLRGERLKEEKAARNAVVN